MIETDLHPADTLFCWLVLRFAESNRSSLKKIKFTEIKDRLHSLYEGAYQHGYEQGTVDEHGESRRPLGK